MLLLKLKKMFAVHYHVVAPQDNCTIQPHYYFEIMHTCKYESFISPIYNPNVVQNYK